MDLLLVRHAIAEDRERFSIHHDDDEQRPLTKLGQQKMILITQHLKKIVPTPDLILTSPLLRAQQTTNILLQYFDTKVQICNELKPEQHPEHFYNYLKSLKSSSNITKTPHNYFVFAVGHEPLLSQILSFCLTGNDSSFCQIKKGGVAHLTDVDAQPYLRKLLTPKTMIK